MAQTYNIGYLVDKYSPETLAKIISTPRYRENFLEELIGYYEYNFEEGLAPKLEEIFSNLNDEEQCTTIEYLLNNEHYEIAYELAFNTKYKNGVTEDFMECCPAGALIYAFESGDNAFINKAIGNLTGNKNYSFEDSEQILEVYRVTGYSRLFENVEIMTLNHFGEIQQEAFRRNDVDTLSKIVEELKENEDYWEALALAEDIDDCDSAEEIKEILGIDDPEMQQYSDLIQTALDIVGNVENKYGITLPKRISVGGPKGSYATIRYKPFGVNDELETRTETET